MNIEDAEVLVALADELALKLAVNQNARWAPVNQCIRALLEEGYIGAPHLVTVEYHAQLSYEPWRASLPHMIFIEAMIHQIDLLRYWFGMPVTVFAQETLSRDQEDQAITVGMISFRFSGGLVATLVSDWINPGNESSYHARLDGPKGSIQAGGRSLRLYSECFPVPGWYEPVLTDGDWYPGIGYLPAFAASMRSFLDAIEQDLEPPTSGRDNLKTLKLTFDACHSAEIEGVIHL
jgi:predicted dehydrogenase